MKTIAVILAGGTGKRFAPLVTSKALFNFLSKPIILHQVEALKLAGFNEIIIVANKHDKSVLQELIVKNNSVTISVQPSAKGMADALLCIQDLIRGKPIFIMNAHDLVEQSLFNHAYSQIKKHNSFIIAKKQKAYIDLGYLNFTSDGKRVVDVVEKPGEGKQPSAYINLVFHYFSSSDEFLNILEKTRSNSDDIYEKALSKLMKQSEVSVLKYEGYWMPLKYPWQVLDMTDLFLRKNLKPKNLASEIAASAQIDDNVYLGKGVKVLANAVIKGPSFIGDNSVVGTGSLIIKSMIEKNCIIGFASEITRSWIGDKCWLHTNYIGDSVLEGENYFGAGAVTANFRFDGAKIHSRIQGISQNTEKTKLGAILARQARVGVNASLMPGVKIGSRSFIGPGVVQYQDVKPGQRVLIKQN